MADIEIGFVCPGSGKKAYGYIRFHDVEARARIEDIGRLMASYDHVPMETGEGIRFKRLVGV